MSDLAILAIYLIATVAKLLIPSGARTKAVALLPLKKLVVGMTAFLCGFVLNDG